MKAQRYPVSMPDSIMLAREHSKFWLLRTTSTALILHSPRTRLLDIWGA